MKVEGLAVIAVLVMSPLFGQPSTPPVASFDVASIRLADNSDGVPAAAAAGRRRSGGRLTWTTTQISLLTYAYHLPEWRIHGLKQNELFYTVNAVTDVTATEDQICLMLQKLLADRFKLATHRQTTEFQGYALMGAPKGAKLKSSETSTEAPPMPEYLKGKAPAPFEGRIFLSHEGRGTLAITGRGVSLSQLADTLSAKLGTFVLDKTGMIGRYYFGFTFKNDGPGESEAPTLFIALQEALGLKLQKQRGPVEVLVVDHMENLPTEN